MDKSKAVAGAGAWMIAAALQVVPQTWPALLNPHPWAVAAFILTGGALFAYGFASHKKSDGQSNVAGRDITGHQITAGRDVHVHPSVTPPAPAPLPSPSKAAISFDIGWRFGWIGYESASGRWRECEPNFPQSRESILLDYCRNVPSRGEGEGLAVVTIAILRFSHSRGSEQIPRAYWVNRREYDVTFNVGDKETLIVGCIEDSTFASYTNPKQGDLMEDNFPTIPYRQLGPRTAIAKQPSITVQISLFDPYASETIEQRKLEILFAADSVSLRELR